MSLLKKVALKNPAPRIFKNKNLLSTDYEFDSITDVVGRDEIIEYCLNHFITLFEDNCMPKPLYIYGVPGSGKTMITKLFMKDLKDGEDANYKIETIYVDCRKTRTKFQFWTDLYLSIPMDEADRKNVGTSSGRLYKLIETFIKEYEGYLFFVLDEIDNCPDIEEVLGLLTRTISRKNKTKPCTVTISNKNNSFSEVSSAIQSTYGKHNIELNPYNFENLFSILQTRAKLALNKGVYNDEILTKCASYGANSHGDARGALELLEETAETANRRIKNNPESSKIIEIEDAEFAELSLERKSKLTVIQNFTLHMNLTLLSVCLLTSVSDSKKIRTSSIYDLYKYICSEIGENPAHYKTVSRNLKDLELMDYLSAEKISQGRKGRSKFFSLTESYEDIKEAIFKTDRFSEGAEEDLNLSPFFLQNLLK